MSVEKSQLRRGTRVVTTRVIPDIANEYHAQDLEREPSMLSMGIGTRGLVVTHDALDGSDEYALAEDEVLVRFADPRFDGGREHGVICFLDELELEVPEYE